MGFGINMIRRMRLDPQRSTLDIKSGDRQSGRTNKCTDENLRCDVTWTVDLRIRSTFENESEGWLIRGSEQRHAMKNFDAIERGSLI